METFKKNDNLEEILEKFDDDEELVILNKSVYDELVAVQEKALELAEKDNFVFGDCQQ